MNCVKVKVGNGFLHLSSTSELIIYDCMVTCFTEPYIELNENSKLEINGAKHMIVRFNNGEIKVEAKGETEVNLLMEILSFKTDKTINGINVEKALEEFISKSERHTIKDIVDEIIRVTGINKKNKFYPLMIWVLEKTLSVRWLHDKVSADKQGTWWRLNKDEGTEFVFTS